MFCPVCEEKQISSKLLLHQINLDEAVYLCEDRQCLYPKGYEWKIVKRNWNDINKTETIIHTESTSEQVETDDLDQWFNELLDTPQVPVLESDGTAFDFEEFERSLVSEGLKTLENEDLNNLAVAEELEKVMNETRNEKNMNKIIILSDVQVRAPTSQLNTNSIQRSNKNEEVEANLLSQIEVKQPKCSSEEDVTRSFMSADLWPQLLDDDTPLNNVSTAKILERDDKNLDGYKISNSQQSDVSIENLETTNQTDDIDAVSSNDFGAFRQNFTEISNVRRSNRTGKGKNCFMEQIKPKLRLKPELPKKVKSRPERVHLSEVETFKVSPELREKVLNQKEKKENCSI